MTRFMRTRCISLEMENCSSSYQDQEIRTVVESGCQVGTSPTVQFTQLECFFLPSILLRTIFLSVTLLYMIFFVPAITFLRFRPLFHFVPYFHYLVWLTWSRYRTCCITRQTHSSDTHGTQTYTKCCSREFNDFKLTVKIVSVASQNSFLLLTNNNK